MNYQEAEAKFQWLESQRAAGRMSEQTYRDELHQIRVVDAAGRHWMLQEHTGQWHVYDGTQWIPAMPPTQSPPPAAQPAYQSPPMVAPQVVPQATPQVAPQLLAQPAPSMPVQRQGCAPSGVGAYLLIWFVGWIVIGSVVFLFLGGKDNVSIMGGVAVAAVFSLILMLFSLAGQWQGQIVDIKIERVYVHDDDGAYWENQTFAYIRQTTGRTRRSRAMGGWQVGDRLEKRRGEAYIRVTK